MSEEPLLKVSRCAGNRVPVALPFLVITWAVVIVVEPARGDVAADNVTYDSACGPISTAAALRFLGVETRFDEIARECEWTEGLECSVAKMCEAMRSRRLLVDAERTDIDTLESHLRRGGVAIVFVRRNSSNRPNHALCISAVSRDGFAFVDLPRGNGRFSRDQLRRVWSGEALLVRRAQYDLGLWPLVCLIAMACILSLLGASLAFPRRKEFVG